VPKDLLKQQVILKPEAILHFKGSMNTIFILSQSGLSKEFIFVVVISLNLIKNIFIVLEIAGVS
jgi:hypothetical protein